MIHIRRFIRDLVIFTVSYYIGFFIRFGYPFPQKNFSDFSRIFPLTLLAFILISLIMDNYPRINLSALEEISGFAAASLITTFIWSTFNYFLHAFALPRSILLIAFILQIIMLTIAIYIERKLGLSWIKKTVGVIGETHIDNISGIPINSPEVIDKVDSVIASSIKSEQEALLLLKAIEKGKDIFIKPKPADIVLHASKFLSLGSHPILYYSAPIISPAERFFKRVMDIIMGLIGSMITVILLPFIGAAIYIDSPGPIFYLQTRLGRNGKPFKVIKFRTMIPNAEKYTGAVLATEDDPRITKVGKFLRKTRLDELPQFFNVLIGDMSTVGPRPERPEMYEKIEKELPLFRMRLMVKPGITGLAQVYGEYDTPPEEKLTYDLIYILSRPKLPLDIRIILMTIKTMLTPSKAK
ncbi:MAG: sugar transferase [Dictyoglomi bacterium]|nr:sugar transferase [Dictyoglomota bacterium]